MRNLIRAGLGALLGVTLLLGPAYAIEYHEIFEMTEQGASDEEIVRLIVEDGRGFEMNEDEIADLRDAGVSEIVIDAMLDPSVGLAWLEDDDRYYDDDGGYSSSLDEAYGQGYRDGRRTALVYSFGYYYGPLARYYYDDPFYYSFWHAGYAYSYWPSYYAYWYRPAYSYYYSYPYNWYNYSSYYCHTYYDPGYWTAHGYTVLPGYGRTVWDDGPRWRDGGLSPVKGGRPSSGVLTRLGDQTRMRSPGSSPPAIREAIASRTDRGVPTVRKPAARTPVAGRPAETRVGAGSGRRATERGNVARGGERAARGNVTRAPRGNSQRVRGTERVSGVRDVSRGRIERGQPAERGRSARVERGGNARVDRPASPARRSEPRVQRGTSRRETAVRTPARRQAVERPTQARRSSGWARSEDRIERRAAGNGGARVIRGNRPEARARVERREASRGHERRQEVRVREQRREEPRYEARRQESRPAPSREPARAERPSRPERNDPPPSRGGNDDGNRGGREDRGGGGRGRGGR